MPLPLGHAAIGIAVHETVQQSPRQGSRLAMAAYIAVLANLPDLDILLGLILNGNGSIFHRGPTHSLLFAILAGIIASQLGRVWPRIPRLGIGLCFMLIFSHVAADMLLTDSPVSMLWPLEVYWSPGHQGWASIVHTVFFKSVQDAGIVAACLAYVFGLRFIRGHRPDVGRLVADLFRKVKLVQ